MGNGEVNESEGTSGKVRDEPSLELITLSRKSTKEGLTRELMVMVVDIEEDRLHHDRSNFPNCVMVSGSIAMLGKTLLYLIESLILEGSQTSNGG